MARHSKKHGHATKAQLKGLTKAWAANRRKGRKSRKAHHKSRR